ncbi:carbohydrate kinase family protein [Microbacterium sp. Mu-80]|uniref:Carbohydrate kinase family protein n=1 Tax=Microbacterium bandirmense TaxID=3122050 RepID=A0ABU8LDT1_9MICO
METGPQMSVAKPNIALVGELFVDIVFADLGSTPAPGRESFAGSMTVAPGGIANSAVAMARLGAQTSLMSGVGEDWFGQWLMLALRREDVDLSSVRDETATSVTASLAYGGERSMVTYSPSKPSLERRPPKRRPDAIVIDLGSPEASGPWWREAAASGSRVYADTRWDDGEDWPERGLIDLHWCHAFLPNAAEALALTKSGSVGEALDRLAPKVPIAVVTCGADGAHAIDSVTGERAWAPALDVSAVDTTGAGDVFLAAFAVADLDGLPLDHRLAFAALCSGLSTTRPSGSFGAPDIPEIGEWWASLSSDSSTHQPDIAVLDRYAFLDDYLPELQSRTARRDHHRADEQNRSA